MLFEITITVKFSDGKSLSDQRATSDFMEVQHLAEVSVDYLRTRKPGVAVDKVTISFPLSELRHIYATMK